MEEVATIIPNRLLWECRSMPKQYPRGLYVLNIDQKLVYENFADDFGPLNLGSTYRFWRQLENILEDPAHKNKIILHTCGAEQSQRWNAGYLIAAFQVIVLRKNPEEAWEPLSKLQYFPPFRDASQMQCLHDWTILDWLRALRRAMALNWFDFRSFNLQEYEFREKLENGDWNWIIPGKFIAMSSPSPTTTDWYGLRVYTPEDHIPVFNMIGVAAVVRLNNKTYEASRFIRNGIQVHELFFVDGTVPSQEIILQFIEIAEKETEALAVHCKAGLGRTGTLIGCYAMKHFRFPAREFIAWNRIWRPGSILGPQQEFLLEMEQVCINWNFNVPYSPSLSPEYQKVAEFGDFEQAEGLISAKASHQTPEKYERPVGPKLVQTPPPVVSKFLQKEKLPPRHSIFSFHTK